MALPIRHVEFILLCVNILGYFGVLPWRAPVIISATEEGVQSAKQAGRRTTVRLVYAERVVVENRMELLQIGWHGLFHLFSHRMNCK